MNGSKALVIGGAGYVGSHVADALSELGFGVTILDRVASPHRRPGQEEIVGDMQDSSVLDRAIAGADVVYHFAGVADIEDAQTRPLDTIELNILATMRIVEACLAHEVSRFVYASSVYVYSDSGGFYRCSKQAAEEYLHVYGDQRGLKYTILRYGTLYGGRSNMTNSIHRYLHQAVHEGKIDYAGDGSEMREYIHVEDAAHGSVEILADEFENQCVMLVGHSPMRVADLFTMIREILGQDIAINYGGRPSPFHYKITPYNFNPRLGKKLVSHYYLDIGQGILACIERLYREVQEAQIPSAESE